MTDKLIELAKSCGALESTIESETGNIIYSDFRLTKDQLEAFANLIRQDEREQLKLKLHGYWLQGKDLDESDYFPISDFTDVDTTDCVPLYEINGARRGE